MLDRLGPVRGVERRATAETSPMPPWRLGMSLPFPSLAMGVGNTEPAGAAVGGADVGSSYTCPSSSRPDCGQRVEDFPEGSTVVRCEQAPHVFQDEPACATGSPNRDNVSYEPPFIIDSEAGPSGGDGLAGESSRDDVDGRGVGDVTEVS